VSLDAANAGAAGAAKSPELLRSIKAVCPKCHRKYRLDERYAGRSLKCRSCGEKFDVPGKVEVTPRPVAVGPGAFALLLKRLVAILTGDKGRTPIRRSRWLTQTQRTWATWVGIAALSLAAIGGFNAYWNTDDAKMRFGRQEGKEIAFRRLVELEEDLAATLRGVRTKANAEASADRVRALSHAQGALWETLVEWQDSGFLTPGESNLLRTRYRDRFQTATETITRERLRTSKIAGANEPILNALKDRGGDVEIARRRVITGGTS